MRTFLRYFLKLHVWLAVNLAALGLFLVLRGRRGVMNALAENVALPWERALGRLCGRVPFSVAELCYAAAILALAVYLVCAVVQFCRAEYKREALYRGALLLANMLLSLCAVFCLLWGTFFYADDFCDKSGIYPQPVSRDDLVAVTRYFADKAALYADEVPRDENGVCAVSRQEALDAAPGLYDALGAEFPFLKLDVDPRPKGVFFSKVMSAMNVTGFYCPYTGESNLNMDFPAATFPATVAHELAHRRGIASEQQCNFLAVLACSRAGDYAYRYSGALLGYIHLANALYAADPEAWAEIRASLPATVDADLRAENAYWAQWEGAVSEASGRAYDAMLKSYGDELGMKSYGAVVDLLVAYYR